MSGKGGGGNSGVGKGSTGISGIPAGSKVVVQSLKEIVNNYSEQEIYATLKECSMDPNEAVNRLLAQDPFHEVKSKKDKKKENKDTGDFRSRGANNTGYATNRGSRGSADRYVGRGGSTQYSANESGPSHGKAAYKRENGVHAYAGTSSTASGLVVHKLNQPPPSQSDSVVTENKMSTVGHDRIPSSSQPSGYQSAWLGVPGQVSMADIVKMGRPQNKVSTLPNPPHQSVNNQYTVAPPPAVLNPHFHSPDVPASKFSEMNNDPEIMTNQDITSNDEWPPIENPSAASVSSSLEAHADSELYANASVMPLDISKQHMNSQIEETEAVDDGSVETHNVDHVGDIQEDKSGGSPLFDNYLYDDTSSYQPRKHAFEHNEGICSDLHSSEDGISSAASNLQQLNLQNDDCGAPPEEDNASVIIPNHLQVHSLDCSHLSFGSFGSGIGASLSGPFASRSSKNDLDGTPQAPDASSMGHSDNRNPEYYGDEHLRNTKGNIADRNNASAGSYEASSDSRLEVLNQETPEAGQGNQYRFPSSATVYSYENTQQLNPALTESETTSQIQNLGPFSSVMQAYTNSLPSTLLQPTVQSVREPDLQYSPFPVNQLPVTKFSNTASSISGPIISMPEMQALIAGTMSTPQPTQQTLPGASITAGPTIPQHLAMNPYSQPTLPLGHFANMISYPFLTQSYTYMPSAFQQTFAGNSSYPQSLAAMLPQYKNSVSVTSLPQSAIPPGYGFGSSTNVPGGNFPLNQPTAPAGSSVGYDDVLSSQYKDNKHLMSLQQAQNENSAMWLHGPGSRTMSAVPESAFYSLQGQNQQQAGAFRQGQQPSQHFGGLGYPNFYHSQTGISLDHHQQNPRDGSLGGSQVQPSKQTQQLWPNY